ncbi:MAG: hypothetical protein SCARUB_04036 [Candidatus Scalindua rubra]|uniref:Uncharacterized protein n=1 Tax=Candidatus Scalindua rubra TaxID=1872076 RepID=A0A1E3X5H4_9BACT|nr:MAG: hypothetical protein SCARUB_04036 [Candidatus Scalindua rubra]
MIHKTIEKDLHNEFVKLKTELKLHLEADFDINQKKEFLKSHIPKEVVYKSKLLLDTLLNYLMDQADKDLEKADIELQNKFFEADFRKRSKEWTTQIENRLELDSGIVKYSTDPRLKQGLITGGIPFVVGSIITGVVSVKTKTVATVASKTVVSFSPYIVAGAIVAGLATIIISTLAFKKAYDKAAPKSLETIKADIDKYLENAEMQVKGWLKSVIEAFNNDFIEFCSSNGFKLEGK